MGCRMLAAVEGGGPRPALLEQVPGWFEEWEQALSRFRPDSELSQLNRSAGKPFKASPVLWDVYRASLDAKRRSAGLVAPTLLDALKRAGYVESFVPKISAAARPGEGSVQVGLPAPGLPVSLRQNRGAKHTILLPEGTHLDFGGIAKGWAAQQASHRLKKAGPALVDAGGDIAISGPCAGGLPWAVGVENPFAPGTDLVILNLGRCGVATSGRDYRRWQQNGKWMHHIIDPRTGLPAETDVLTATVIAADVLQAETAAKTVFILGSRTGIEWLQAHPAMAGMLILEDGGYIYTRNFEGYLAAETGGLLKETL